MTISGLAGGLLHMNIIVRDRDNASAISSFPAVILVKDNWDDYGFKTSFYAELHLSSTNVVELGMVKVLRYEYAAEPYKTLLPRQSEGLSLDFCSLGNSLEYYEKLNEIDRHVRDLYLRCMNDVVFDSKIKQRFEERPGFNVSLLRSPSAASALENAHILVAPEALGLQLVKLDYVTADGGALLPLRFNSNSPLPGRINAIIGYNGVGKTTVLAGIAQVAASTLRRRNEADVIKQHGRFEGSSQRFATTIAVSYSAFDTFEVPDIESRPEWEEIEDDEKIGYHYCGLRRHGAGTQANELKSEQKRLEELDAALALLTTSTRKDALNEALDPLLNEPSFRRSGTDFSFHDSAWKDRFTALSSGHQIALSIVVQLVAHMKVGSLALIDEPESHLHPPLLAALMKGIGIALDKTSSFAVLATHSPVVLQEIPKACVHVLRRVDEERRFDKPTRETYGENLGVLTSEVFNLDNSDSSYEGVLRLMAQTMPSLKIQEHFPDGLSGQARALLMQEGVEF